MSEAEPALAPITARLLMVAFFFGGPILALAPLGMAPLLMTAAAGVMAAERLSRARWLKAPPLYLFLTFAGWCAISLIWDLNRFDGLRKLIDLSLVLASLWALQAAGERASAAQRRGLAGALAGGMAISLIVLSIETAFDFPLYRAVMGDADPRLVDLGESKRSVDALPLLVWPAALAVTKLGKLWLALILLAVFTVASFKWTASSATLGMMASLLILGAGFLSIKVVRLALTAATILAFVFVIPFAILAYDQGGTSAAFLKRSAQHRVEIWHFAAENALERPLLGYGFNASRHIPNGDSISAFLESGKPIIPLHPHDGFLQIWLELGAIGAIIAAITLLTALRTMAKWPDNSSRFALAGYAAGMIIAGLAFGLWQTWWMATLAFSAVAFSTLERDPHHA